jgi:hypothetical protein
VSDTLVLLDALANAHEDLLIEHAKLGGLACANRAVNLRRLKRKLDQLGGLLPQALEDLRGHVATLIRHEEASDSVPEAPGSPEAVR